MQSFRRGIMVRAWRFAIPANTRRWPNVGLTLGQRRRRWADVSPTLGQRLVFAEKNDVSTRRRVVSNPTWCSIF